MTDFRSNIDSLFVENLGFDFTGESLPIPEIEGNENIINISKEYSGSGIDVILVECNDRILEFQKKLIKNQKPFFPNSHFLFISNNGKVYDIYNISTSKKLKPITYNELEKNTSLFKEKIQLFNIETSKDSVDLRINIEKAFDTNDKVTKKFFDKFKSIHKKLQKGIQGIDKKEDIEWYASVILNRLMFVYFLQKHNVIQNDPDFLLSKFKAVRDAGKDYYKDFLLPLFFYGFAKRDNNPFKQDFVKQYGPVRYLNGGLFYPHHIERKYYAETSNTNPRGEKYINTKISVNADVLYEILNFLNGYTWYLDNRPMKEDTDINPDVLGYIFEKYINQKELGAYYTKEDITEYISKNTIIPFIFDKLRNNGFVAPEPDTMITNNEDIIGNMADYIEQLNDYKTLKFLYKDILCEMSVLDPSVGSGAFLFAALNILLPIYRKTVFRLKGFKNEYTDDDWLQALCHTLETHSEEYYLTKQIILNNLYGVDIVEEATEICKLRLFLQLASHLPDITAIEPLPDIDFNIYAGNSLVGGLSWEDLQNNYTMDLFTAANRDKIKENIDALTELKQEYKIVNEQISQLAALKEEYKKLQQEEQNEERLKQLKDSIQFLENEINGQIKVGIDNPFHWFIEFDAILKKGGFDIVIGNPPYVEYSKVKNEYTIKGYNTEKCGNLYANFIERSYCLLDSSGRFSMIIPISSISTKRMSILQSFIKNKSKNIWISNFAERPSKLFEGAEVSLSILIADNKKNNTNIFTTKYNKWKSENRDKLFTNLTYTDSRKFITNQSIPKIGNPIDNRIFEKIYNSGNTIANLICNNSEYKICYRNAGGRYYKIVLNFEPDFYVNGVKTQSSTYYFLNFKNESLRDGICAIMNSNLFFYIWLAYSDTWHMTINDIYPFPVPNNEALFEKLSILNKELMSDFISNSQCVLEKRNKGKDEVKLFKFTAKNSKNIIDKIDKELSAFYGFTEEELQHIINYDIDFRKDEE